MIEVVCCFCLLVSRFCLFPYSLILLLKVVFVNSFVKVFINLLSLFCVVVGVVVLINFFMFLLYRYIAILSIVLQKSF